MKLCIYIGIALVLFCACNFQNRMIGNVYKLSSNEGIDVKEQDDLIKGFRIDDMRDDTLLLKYEIGNGILLDANFIYDHSINSYKTRDKIILGIAADKKSVAYLRFKGLKQIYMEYIDLLGNKNVKYQKVYNMKVALKHDRDSAYVEEGFSL